jgi:hypothetical protein
MNPDQMAEHIRRLFPGTVALEGAGSFFLVHDPDGDLPDAEKMPFATVVTSDAYDQASDLARPGVYRLNIGLPRDTYLSMFGSPRDDERPYDFRALDDVMPHPVYSAQYWICILDPGDGRLELLDRLLREARDLAVRKYVHRRARRGH